MLSLLRYNSTWFYATNVAERTKNMNVMERLNQKVKEKGPLLAGLDPDIVKLSELAEALDYRGSTYDFLQDYCFEYIEAVKDVVPAIKINIAFFESLDLQDTFWKVVNKAKEAELFVIGDIKRADIGNTSAQYAQRFMEDIIVPDAITINPYFGTDGVQPFLDFAKKNDKGVFVLTKTSNPSSDEIQNLVTEDGETVYQKVGHLVDKWGKSVSGESKYSLVGAVVGATHPIEAEELRKMLPNTFFLVPGYGAQGATARDIVVNFDSEGGGAVVNSSRGLMFAYKSKRWCDKFSPNRWAEATRTEAIRAQYELVTAIKTRS